MDANVEDVLIRFGKRLRVLRKAAGYSQEGFALECGLDRSYVGAIERGERNLSLRNLDKFANVLGIRLSELFDGI